MERARNFYRANKDLYEDLINAGSFLPDLYTKLNDDGSETLSIHNVDNKVKEKFSVKVVKRLLVEYGFLDWIPFSPEDVYEAYLKYE
ncbi:hypothetical protein GKC33_12300 [Lactobacillus salivarius]|uniref:Uncharacterized protein n=1 Tax=Ligilactobacillus salivarius TaxID=1624 RepID=A0A7X2STE1_9LACO|nr:hypothetical protein [Ligilactobacillus salivarius]